MISSTTEEDAALARFVVGEERARALVVRAVAEYDAAVRLTRDPRTRGILTAEQMREVCYRAAVEALDELEAMRHVRTPAVVP